MVVANATGCLLGSTAAKPAHHALEAPTVTAAASRLVNSLFEDHNAEFRTRFRVGFDAAAALISALAARDTPGLPAGLPSGPAGGCQHE